MSGQECTGLRELLVDFTDGELDPTTSAYARVARHLGSCESCRQLALRLRKSISVARAEWTRRERAIQHAPARKRALRLAAGFGALGTAAGVVFVVLSYSASAAGGSGAHADAVQSGAAEIAGTPDLTPEASGGVQLAAFSEPPPLSDADAAPDAFESPGSRAGRRIEASETAVDARETPGTAATRSDGFERETRDRAAAEDQQAGGAAKPESPRDAMQAVWEGGVAAEMLAAAEKLERAGARRQAAARLKYIVDTFPDTEAARDAAARLEFLKEVLE